ncbi:MAG: permease [Alphaproteobacteria bacterium]
MSVSVAFLARHEARLGWRELLWMLTAGHRRRPTRVLVGFAVFVIFLHWLSYVVLTHGMAPHISNDLQTLTAVTISLLLAWMLMLSQAMESITRGFYTRGDLDLILSSPVPPSRVFALRVAVNAALVSVMSVLLVGPVVNVLAATDSVRWLGGYGVALALGLSTTAFAVLLTVALFHLAGPKRTRFIAQVVAAIVGAVFVIGLQVAAILHSGTLSRAALLHSPLLLAHVPPPASPLWLPARAIMGDGWALLAVLCAAIAVYAAITFPLVGRFGRYATEAAGTAQATVRHRQREKFVALRPMQALRQKEWLLISRDPWLVSQTLMQLLYLLPPALLLWLDYAGNGHGVHIVAPVLVMAAGQLAGGITWITISGEDAPDLIATSPLSARQVLTAKLQAVMRAVATVFVPLLALLALGSPWTAAVSAGGIVLASGSAALIQLWFRTQAKRSAFRRRHTASRIATFAEAFCCLAWAATAALAAAKSWFALAPFLLALVILLLARWARTSRAR